MPENKVQFNLKNVHYAVLTLTDGVASWANPVAVPGAVSLSLDPHGEVSSFYADGLVYYQSAGENGYSGDLEMARFHDQMLQDVWGMVLNSTDKVLVEQDSGEVKSFALLYQIDGDVNNDLYCLYNCTASRPGLHGATSTETKEPTTQSSTVSAAPLPDGRVLARTTADTPEAVRTACFKSVYEGE